jgi:hypothetical protein
MTIVDDIDWPQVFADRLTASHPDVLRELLSTFFLTLMGAEADALCGAGRDRGWNAASPRAGSGPPAGISSPARARNPGRPPIGYGPDESAGRLGFSPRPALAAAMLADSEPLVHIRGMRFDVLMRCRVSIGWTAAGH